MKKNKKPPKPYKDFPLFAHSSGQWAKKIAGKTIYFGKWSDPETALARYLDQRDYLHAGQNPPDKSISLHELVNRFLTDRREARDNGELSEASYHDYVQSGKTLLSLLGKTTPVYTLTPLHFSQLRRQLGKGCNATTLRNKMVRIKAAFNWAMDVELIPPVRFKRTFALPDARQLRKARQGQDRTYSREEILTLLDTASEHVNMYAMILLGINAALGNTDCAELRERHLNLTTGILVYPRPKTEAARRAILWPETITAIQNAIEARNRRVVPEELEDRIFMTQQFKPYIRFNEKGTPIDAVVGQFTKFFNRTKLPKGRGFYGLRHTFRTVADETLDYPAIDLVMGHVPSDMGAPHSVVMAARYRQKISDDRLTKVSDYVRDWLFG